MMRVKILYSHAKVYKVMFLDFYPQRFPFGHSLQAQNPRNIMRALVGTILNRSSSILMLKTKFWRPRMGSHVFIVLQKVSRLLKGKIKALNLE